MSMLPTLPVKGKDKYKDGRTSQAFKDQTDINKIIERAQKTGTVNHLTKYEPMYGDFSDVDDLLTAHARLERGKQIFNELPSEVRREFDQDWSKFFRFVNDPAKKDELKKLLPAIAKSGGYYPVVNEGMGGSPAAEEAAAASAAAKAAPDAAPEAQPPVEQPKADAPAEGAT